jgi:hypothetical protein
MSETNPLLAKLGRTLSDRLIILQADDIGMSYGSVLACKHLLEAGIDMSVSVMPPGPWFKFALQTLKEHHPGPLDLGIHFTLTSEWRTHRWGPVSPEGRGSGLCDPDGYFWPTSKEVRLRAKPAQVYEELKQQVCRVRDCGLTLTHVDAHMGVVFCDSLFETYFRLAQENALLALMIREDRVELLEMGFSEASLDERLRTLRVLEQTGLPLLDRVIVMALDDPRDRLQRFRTILASLPIGVTEILFHPLFPTPDSCAISPDWECRVADYEFLMGDDWRCALREAGVQMTSWREISNVTQHGQRNLAHPNEPASHRVPPTLQTLKSP